MNPSIKTIIRDIEQLEEQLAVLKGNLKVVTQCMQILHDTTGEYSKDEIYQQFDDAVKTV